MPDRAALGAEGALGIRLEEPSPRYNLGRPKPDITALAAPSTPATTGLGAAGTITGTVVYYQAFRKKGGFLTDIDAGSTPLVCTADQVAVSAIEVSASSDCDARYIYRSHDAGVTKYLIKILWDNTTTSFTDNIATDSPYINLALRPVTYNETGQNGGFKFLQVESKDLKADYKLLRTTQLTGTGGVPRGIPGGAVFAHVIKDAVAAGALVPLLASLISKPTKYGVAAAAFVADGDPVDEPTKKYVFTPPAAGEWDPVSFSLFDVPGGTVPPQFFWQNMAEELTIQQAEGKYAELDAKIAGAWHWKGGLATAVLDAGAPDYTTLPCAFGVRQDVNKATKSMVVKVTTGPATGTFGIKAKKDPVAAYGSAETTVTYDGTSKKQDKAAANSSDKIELLEETGLAFGADSGENRKPVMIVFPGDVTNLEANDEFTFPITPLIPAIGSTPGTPDGTYTGFPRVILQTPRYTASHLTLSVGSDAIEIQGGSLKLGQGKKPIYATGKEAAYALDMERDGYATAAVTFNRRWLNRDFEAYMEADERFALQWKMEGERIPVSPGVVSTFRETIQLDATQAAVSDTKAPTSAPGTVPETVTIEAEDPANGDPPFTITVITREDWQFES